MRSPCEDFIDVGEDGFEGAIANLRYDLEREIKSLKQDIALYTKHVADWAPVVWPRVQPK